jgi:TolB-like protein
VEAARLRTKLAEYYAGEGRGHALLLTTIDAVAMSITEGVTAELVRDGRFSLVASTAASAAAATTTRPRDVAAMLNADVLIEARLTIDGDRVRAVARASDGSREQKLWVAYFVGGATESDPMTREIAAAITNALAR